MLVESVQLLIVWPWPPTSAPRAFAFVDFVVSLLSQFQHVLSRWLVVPAPGGAASGRRPPGPASYRAEGLWYLVIR